LLAILLAVACGSSPAAKAPDTPTAVPLTGVGYPVERASPLAQNLLLSGAISYRVTRARAICVDLPPPPEAEFSAQVLLELKDDRYLLVMAARPYLGPHTYHDASGGAIISLRRWRSGPAEPAARPLESSLFSVGRSGLAGTIDAGFIPISSGSVAIKGSWRCQPTS
jgi:hypothetical protein